MRQKNLPSSTITNLRRCVLHEKKTNQNIRVLSRVCFPVRDFPQNFCLPIMGVATSPLPLLSMLVCLPRPCMNLPPSVIFGWENKWLMRYSCHFPVILFYFFLSPSFYEYVIIVLFFQKQIRLNRHIIDKIAEKVFKKSLIIQNKQHFCTNDV